MKIIIVSIGIVILLLYILPLTKSKINIGNIFGIVVGLLFLFCGIFYNQIINLLDNKLFSIIFYLLVALLIVFFIIFIITLMLIILASKQNAKNENIVIVLGCRVKGSIPSKALSKRCEVAYNHLVKNPNSVAILSGGQGQDEDISEAECMKRILLEKGISENRLILENKSTSTYENLLFSKRIIEEKNIKGSIAVASSEYHLLRTKMLAKKLNLKIAVIPAKSIRFLRVPEFTREVFAIWYTKIKK